MKTKSDIIFNIIKYLPFVAYGVAIVFNIINRHYDWAVMNVCLIVMYIIALALVSKLESAMELADEYKEMYKDERAHSFLMLDILGKALESADLAEDMLRIFNNVDKMYKKYGDNN